MASLNKWIGIGRLGRDIEINQMPNGVSVSKFSIATDESWKDKNTGEKKTETTWHNLVLYGKIAEIAAQFLVKGSMVCVEGKYTHRKWTDKDGNERVTSEVKVDDLVMLGGGVKKDHGGEESPKSQTATKPKTEQLQRSYQDDQDDDIPF